MQPEAQIKHVAARKQHTGDQCIDPVALKFGRGVRDRAAEEIKRIDSIKKSGNTQDLARLEARKQGEIKKKKKKKTASKNKNKDSGGRHFNKCPHLLNADLDREQDQLRIEYKTKLCDLSYK